MNATIAYVKNNQEDHPSLRPIRQQNLQIHHAPRLPLGPTTARIDLAP